MCRYSLCGGLVVVLIAVCAFAGDQANQQSAAGLTPAVVSQAGVYELSFGNRAPIRTTRNPVSNPSLVRVSDSDAMIAAWYEGEGASRVPFFSYSHDGVAFKAAVPTSYDIHLEKVTFEPLTQADAVPMAGLSETGGNMYLVQLIATGIDPCYDAIKSAGGHILAYIPENTYIVKIENGSRQAIESLPFVRWVGSFHSDYRISPEVLDGFSLREQEAKQYRIKLANRTDMSVNTRIADSVRSVGGVVDYVPDLGSILVATLTPEQVRQVAAMDDVLYIDLSGTPRRCMNNARAIGGADYVESVAGYTGQGVRGEVMDDGVQADHPAYDDRLVVRLGATVQSHGTSTTGIVFGDGTGSANGRGMLPDGDAVFSQWASSGRYSATAPLVTSTWHCVFQSNSWHTGDVNWSYTSFAEVLDEIVFDMDLLILQAQGNYSTSGSGREAWAKNIISVGGINHRNTLTKSDDYWGDASIGPCDDGRIKPDLSHFYDYIRCPTTGSGYTSYFGGTSGATPIVAGHAGIMFQMWADGIFGNPVSGGSVFYERPHAATAKALLINSASPYDFSGSSHNLTRVHQGWGLPDVENLYDMRDSMLVVDETDILNQNETVAYARSINPGNFQDLRVTLVWTDPPGTGSSSRDRINNLDLKVTSPSGTIYHGNQGLTVGNYSTSGGSADLINTVENVFISDPEVGNWTIGVTAATIAQDGHPETGATDADFGLVISGGSTCPGAPVTQQPSDVSQCEGGTVTFSALSDEPGVTYHWQKNGLDLSDDPGHISGVTTTTLTVEGIDASDVAGYRCKITNDCAPSFSRTAALSLASGPSVGTQPQDLSKCAGEVATFTVAAEGKAPLSYQWEKDGNPIDGATLFYYTIESIATDDAGAYRCQVINDCGDVFSEEATLEVLDAPTITAQPEDTCAELGETATFTVTLDGTPPYFFQWSHDGQVISGSNTQTLTITGVQASDAGQYSVLLVSYSAPDCEVTSETAELQVGDCGGALECTHEVYADLDDDGDVDFEDFSIFQVCFGADGALTPGCECANLDASDEDIDLDDYLLFELFLAGPQ